MSIHITGTAAGQSIVYGQSIRPLSGVTITDDASSAFETVTVTLSNVDAGPFWNLGAGFYDPFAGQYYVTGSASSVTAALNSLAFTPTLLFTATTTLTITVKDGLAPAATESNTTVVTTVTVGGGQTLTESPGFVASLANTGLDFDTVNGSGGNLYLTSASASVFGGDVGIHFTGSDPGSASLYNTNGHWDTIDGATGNVILNGAQASVLTGDHFRVVCSDDLSNAVSIYNTDVFGDFVQGGSGLVTLNNATAALSGNYIVFFAQNTKNTANFAFYNISRPEWETVYGSFGIVNLINTNASIIGGGNTIGPNGSSISLYQTAGQFDSVASDDCNIALNGAQASIFGNDNTIFFNSGVGNAASLYNTSNGWDFVYGSSGAIALNSAQASILGGGDSVYFTGTSSTASLYKTNGDADHVGGDNATLILNDAQASLTGDANSVYLNGFYNTLALDAGFGATTVHGFAFNDVLQFAKSDFADFSALHPTQSGADTVIALDASHSVTLANVNAATLTASQFAFV